MNKILQKLILIFCLCTSVIVIAEPIIDISGRYRCRGNNFFNNTTFDEPTIVRKTGDTFHFVWLNKNVFFFGTAILREKTLSTVFWTPSDMNSLGVVTYDILPNGDLKGKWTLKDAKEVGDEYCERLK